MKESLYRIVFWSVAGFALWLITLNAAKMAFAESEREFFCERVAIVSVDLAIIDPEYRIAYLYEIRKRNQVLATHIIPATDAALRAYEDGYTKDQILYQIYEACLKKMGEA